MTTRARIAHSFASMQPSLLTAIPLRLDNPDPSRCTECKMPKRERATKKPRTRRGLARPRP
jgi:hypothetical protein